MMYRLRAYVNDLQSVLDLECSKKEAKQYGTIKEWKAINRRISKIRRAANRLEKAIYKTV